MSTTAIHREALRKVGRESKLVDLRDGRVQRASRIPSGKVYKRKAKYPSR